MTAQRTFDERLTDAALLLTLWSRCAKDDEDDLGDKLRLMKLAFLASNGLREHGIRGLTTAFYRWRWGPMSNEVYDVWELLTRADLLESEEHFLLTEDGASLADEFATDVLKAEENADIQAVFDDVARLARQYPATADIMQFVYGMQVTPLGSSKTMPIRDVPLSWDLVEPLAKWEATRTLAVDRGWLETLALEFSPSARARLRRAEADFREGRFVVA